MCPKTWNRSTAESEIELMRYFFFIIFNDTNKNSQALKISSQPMYLPINFALKYLEFKILA